MRTLLALGLGLLAMTLPVAPALGGSEGPFSGQVRRDEVDTHHYNNNPDGNPCADVMRAYTVTLAYAPAIDTLGLSAGGQSAVGADGVARVAFWASDCTAFDIAVAGLQVADVADYEVVVTADDGVTF